MEKPETFNVNLDAMEALFNRHTRETEALFLRMRRIIEIQADEIENLRAKPADPVKPEKPPKKSA